MACSRPPRTTTRHRRLAAGSMKEHFRALRQVLQLWSEDKLGESAPETRAHFQQRVAEARAAIRHGGGQRVLAVSPAARSRSPCSRCWPRRRRARSR